MRGSAKAPVFKTARFARTAYKAGIGDDALCEAIREVMKGQAVDLGGGVFKKRLDRNRSRSIILAKSGRFWIYEYLFAKKDRDNISSRDLEGLRALAKSYAALPKQKFEQLVENGDLKEICHDDEASI